MFGYLETAWAAMMLAREQAPRNASAKTVLYKRVAASKYVKHADKTAG